MKDFMSNLGLGIVLAVVALVVTVLAWGIWQERQLVPVVGTVYLITLAAIPVAGFIVGLVWLVKFILKLEAHDIGPTGTVFQWFGRTKVYHPLGVQEHKSKVVEVKEEKKVEIPSLQELLKQGLVGMGELLLGYYLDGKPCYGTWEDVKTFAIGGKSRSGKTVSVVFFIVQALIAGAQVFLCDPHSTKPDGLLKVLEKLVPFMRVGRNPSEIVAVVKAFHREMLAREDGTSENTAPQLLVVDEWTYLLRKLDKEDADYLVEIVLGCAEAWAGYGGYALIAGHAWTANESGGKYGAELRRGLHAVMVHKINEEYARFLIQGGGRTEKKCIKSAPTLKQGQGYLQDTDGEIHHLMIPYYGSNREGVTEAAIMLQRARQEVEGSLEYTNENRAHIGQYTSQYTPQYSANTLLEAPNTPDNTPAEGANTPLNTVDKIRVLNSSGVAVRYIMMAVHMSGPKRGDFYALCEKNGIVIKNAKES